MRAVRSSSRRCPRRPPGSRCRFADVALIALKIDVDTYRGTREGALRLADLLERLALGASFLFSLGPDPTGRAIKRIFRRGFLGKVQRTSVLEHYGLRTLLYGVLLPGPHIGRRCREPMQQIARRGFEVGVHTFDHVRWQDSVAGADEPWTRREFTLAHDEFMEVFGRAPRVHGAAGWQMNRYVPALEQEFGFRYASDTRGRAPFLPLLEAGGAGGRRAPSPPPPREFGFRYASDTRGRAPFLPLLEAGAAAVAQLPTTLPTLDELIGRAELGGD